MDNLSLKQCFFLLNVSQYFSHSKHSVLNEKVNMHLRQRRTFRYSALIGSIFLNLHFFFMWCIHIFWTSFSRLVFVRTHERKRKKKGQLNSNSSLYEDKKELLPYQARHCYWMIFCAHIRASLMCEATFMAWRESKTLFNCFICLFSFTMSSKSVLLGFGTETYLSYYFTSCTESFNIASKNFLSCL